MDRGKLFDLVLTVLLVIVLAGVPYGIYRYNQVVISANTSSTDRVFTLTGHSERGWILEDVYAFETVGFWKSYGNPVGR